MAWTLVQKSSATGSAAGNNVTPALPGASTAGNLLVAFISDQGSTDTLSGPAGWVNILREFRATGPGVSVWAYLANPGAITSATFSDTAGNLADSYLGEFTTAGVSGAFTNKTGVAISGSTATTLAVSTSGSVTAGDLGVCFFGEAQSSVTWTTPSGWTLLESNNGGLSGVAPFIGYLPSATAGTLSVTGTSNISGFFAGSVVTFTAAAGIAARHLTVTQAVKTAAYR